MSSCAGAVHINGIKGFLGLAKSRPGKFLGMSKRTLSAPESV